jgi:hypothetical protein
VACRVYQGLHVDAIVCPGDKTECLSSRPFSGAVDYLIYPWWVNIYLYLDDNSLENPAIIKFAKHSSLALAILDAHPFNHYQDQVYLIPQGTGFRSLCQLGISSTHCLRTATPPTHDAKYVNSR